MEKRTTRIIISSIALVAVATCVVIVCSFVTAKRAMNRLHASGFLSGEHYVGARLSLYSSLRTNKVQPCWVFRFEDIETDSNHYVSLTGKYLGSRGYGRQAEFEVKRWVSVGNARRGYLDQEQYKKIAMDYLIMSPPDNADVPRFDFGNALPMIPDGSLTPKRFRDIVRLQIELRRQYRSAQTNGYFPSEYLEVLMTKSGQIVKAKRQRCWMEGLGTNDERAPNQAPEAIGAETAPQFQR